MAKRYKQANYDFDVQFQPKIRMGQGEPQNMPAAPIIKPFPRSTDIKSGITNRFEKDVEVLSGINENDC